MYILVIGYSVFVSRRGVLLYLTTRTSLRDVQYFSLEKSVRSERFLQLLVRHEMKVYIKVWNYYYNFLNMRKWS